MFLCQANKLAIWHKVNIFASNSGNYEDSFTNSGLCHGICSLVELL